MKVLILNGSPRRNGKVSQILHTMEKRLQDDGNETEFVDVNMLNFKCCIGCMKMYTSTGRCSSYWRGIAELRRCDCGLASLLGKHQR